ncbi:hypothetical protein ACVWXM_007650 [Bradyrhizobium sp. GM7.3]
MYWFSSLRPDSPYLLQRLELRRDGGQELDDDGGGDVRHDVQRKDRHAVNAAASEHIEHAEDAARLGAEHLLPDVGIDAGQRDVGPEPINEQRAQGEPDALLQFVGLGKRTEIEIGCQLFRCRGHLGLSPAAYCAVMPAAGLHYTGHRTLSGATASISPSSRVRKGPRAAGR